MRFFWGRPRGRTKLCPTIFRGPRPPGRASKDDAGAEPAWKGWWPDLDVDATRRLTRGSAPTSGSLPCSGSRAGSL